MNCAVCGLPLWPALVQLGENTHPTCDRFDDAATYCQRGCPDRPDCCLKAKTWRPIHNVTVGDKL